MADEPFGVRGLVNRGFEHPAVRRRFAELAQWLDPDTATTVPVGQAQEATMSYIPPAIKQRDLAQLDG
jgi:hypothetical protein